MENESIRPIRSHSPIDGKEFGKTLVAITQLPSVRRGCGTSKTVWLVRCKACGNEEDITRDSLMSGRRKHCRACRSWNQGNQNRKGKTLDKNMELRYE